MSLGFVSRSRLTSTFSPSSDEKTIPCSDSIDQITFKGLTIPIYISLTFLDTYPLLECTFFVVLYSLDRWVSSSFKITKIHRECVHATASRSFQSTHAHSISFPITLFSIINESVFPNKWMGACVDQTHSLTHRQSVKKRRLCVFFMKLY